MENAVDALKIAFAVMVFTMALTLAISTFSQARETSEAVLFMNDKTNYYSWEDEVNYSEDKRKVGIDAIIPTLYRYYKENYTVIFEDINKPIYYLDSTNKWDRLYTDRTGDDDEIYYFDLNKEIQANCPWVGTVNDIKKNLDLFLKGTTGYSFGNASRKVKYIQGFIEKYKDATFLEELGEYATDRTYGMINIDGTDYLEVQTEDGKTGRFSQTSDKWKPESNFSVKQDDGTIKQFSSSNLYSIDEIATAIGSSATTFISEDTNGEIIELAKPTIKRVIKYTKLP